MKLGFMQGCLGCRVAGGGGGGRAGFGYVNVAMYTCSHYQHMKLKP